ncbi:MAG: DUF116 domain-containing protein [Nitrososphaerales archaeon]
MEGNLVRDRKTTIIRLLERLSKSKILGQTLLEVERLLSSADVSEQDLLRLYVTSKNNVNRELFASTPYKDRVLLLPQCLRASECQAPLDEEGYHCLGCGRCLIKEVKKEAEELGYKVFVLAGGSMVEKVFNITKPKACLGVACIKELVLGGFVSEKKNVVPYAVALAKDGCINTYVDLEELKASIRLYKP